MQRYRIFHRTVYTYDRPVTLASHTLRLRPREDHDQRIESSTLDIRPQASLRWQRDAEDNAIAVATFQDTCSELFIESEVIIQQFNLDPYDFLVDERALYYPFEYTADERAQLASFRPSPGQRTRQLITDWLEPVWDRREVLQTYSLLDRISSYISKNLRYEARHTEGVQSAAYTLSFGSGSCRDFAELFITIARCLGLAARFVTGYLYVLASENDQGATHAWVEVFLPGAGWIGFDPTLGRLAGADHIVVAVSRDSDALPPVEGAYWGGASSSLDVRVEVSAC